MAADIALRLAAACALICLVGAPPARAQEQQAPGLSDRVLSDPTYLPRAGHFYLDAGYDYQSETDSVFDLAGGQTSSGGAITDEFTGDLAYGVTDAISVSIGEAYEFQASHGANTGAAALFLNARGLSNPTFEATWRVLRSSEAPVNLDLSAAVAPDIFNARSGAPDEAGTIAHGGGIYQLRAAIGHVTPMFTIQGIFDASYLGRDTENGSEGQTSTLSAYWQPEAGLATQTRFSSRLSLNLEAVCDFASSAGEVVLPAAVPLDIHRGAFGQAYAALNYHLILNRLVASLEYEHGLYGATREDYLDAPADDELDHRSTDTVGLRLWYAFK